MTGCIYHEADLDGVMSAAIVKKYFKGDIDLLPYNYGKEIPDVNKYDKERGGDTGVYRREKQGRDKYILIRG